MSGEAGATHCWVSTLHKPCVFLAFGKSGAARPVMLRVRIPAYWRVARQYDGTMRRCNARNRWPAAHSYGCRLLLAALAGHAKQMDCTSRANGFILAGVVVRHDFLPDKSVAGVNRQPCVPAPLPDRVARVPPALPWRSRARFHPGPNGPTVLVHASSRRCRRAPFPPAELRRREPAAGTGAG
jgi:hypothetical protein